MTKNYGLIGFPLGHSFSPSYFKKKFQELNLPDHSYKAFPIASIHGLQNLDLESMRGLNVTVPYKETVIPFLDELSDEASNIGAVNTIHIEDGKLIGYNTDIYGFEASLSPLLHKDQDYKALILGTGGASKAVKFVLDRLNIESQFVSRNKELLNYRSLTAEIIHEHKLIVNTTPVGMAPQVKQCPRIPYEAIGEKHLVYDLIYNPVKTKFLQLAEDQGARIKNGYEMLKLQAEKSWEIWNE